ncbi:MAG: sigma-54-dependent Fis family transcriptional regulator [Acetobacteraceae bacterium]|nr:sigma-54-dependent Fis family transcriptional regulator [Acetobacteraceae bacterium]
MARVLIVDDDAALREGIAETLGDLGHNAEQAGDGAAALTRLARGGIDAVLLDLRMPGMDGLAVLKELRARRDQGDAVPPVAVLTAVPTAANTIEAMRLGAVDHIAKPIGRDALAALVARMLPVALAAPSATPADGSDALIGTTAAMREVQKAVGMLADSDATVLITGETGTGKEVVARAIHRHGRRAAQPFEAVNCAAIPAGLLESQLFGHVRGAFTGAVGDALGSVRAAHKGTLFLDEIGDMDLAMQAKLLRVLQERVVVPVGGKPVAVDVRVLAATHQDLPAMVRAGRFREDLYWRLGVVPLHLPPLRDRLGDIVPLAEHFLALSSGTARQLSAGAAARLLRHAWPGNVRELRNAMERVAALARRAVVGEDDLDFLAAGPATAPEDDLLAGTLPEAVARLEATMIRRALARSGGNRAEAARLLGIHRQLLYEKLRQHGIELSGTRTEAVGKDDR